MTSTSPHPVSREHDAVLTRKTIWWSAVALMVVGIGVAVWLMLAPGHGNELEAIKTAGTIVIGTGGAAALLLAARQQRTAEHDLVEKRHDRAHRSEVRYSVLSVRTIWWAAALILVVGIGVAVWLLLAYGRGDTQQRNQLEAIKTAGTIVIGTGGAAALLLAARRQRTAEIALKQKDRDQADVARAFTLQERVAAATEADAAERRITELYTKAADQLGSDKAPVRLAGLYALERLAQANPEQRQSIVNLLCAYLRMPHQPPRTSHHRIGVHRPLRGNSTRRPTPAPVAMPRTAAESAVQEREVRLAAQRVLAHHLRPHSPTGQPADTFWTDMDLDLTGAALIDFSLSNCTVGEATFRLATFTGAATFGGTAFTGETSFRSATFTDEANFGDASSRGATFTGGADFALATFTGDAYFGSATFIGEVHFSSATFTSDVNFGRATFTGTASFAGVTFTGCADFGSANFTDYALFSSASFTGGTRFESATFAGPTEIGSANFARGVPREVVALVPVVARFPDAGTQ